ncbi:MAG: hypothetical protein Q9217_006428 [Psora testacea]
MVYQGKPSTGCANCRKRKIKCDEGRPACSQCIKTKRTCPGYVARFDLVLRDQTNAVRQKAQRKKELPSVSQKTTSSSEASYAYALAGSGEGSSSCAVVKRSNSSAEAVPRMFDDLPEQQAICAFFLDFVLLPRHPDSVRGHLEHLLPLYQRTSPHSPLSLATSSVALAVSGNSQSRPWNQQRARTTFGQALKKTSAAIRDPIESFKDETLMAVLLLGLFERITASSSASKPYTNMTSTHNAGAAALVKHRGRENCTSPVAIGMLFAVRTQLVEHAIEEATAFKRCSDGLSEIFSQIPKNAAARLTSVTINIADLRSGAKSALQLDPSPASEKEVNDFLEYAISIDLLVAAWAESVPEEWFWTPATHFDLPNPATHGYTVPSSAFQYMERKDIYLDLWVMSIWNQYRSARIRIQCIILSCIHWLGPQHEAQWYWRSVYAKMIAQQMADDICASVPFALGTKTFGGGSGGPGNRQGVEYPYAAVKGKVSDEHRRAASALGGWHLLDPLRTCVRAEMESHDATVLRPGQGNWCAEQMERIGRIYALSGQQRMGRQGVWDRYSYEFPT